MQAAGWVAAMKGGMIVANFQLPIRHLVIGKRSVAQKGIRPQQQAEDRVGAGKTFTPTTSPQ